MPELPEVETTRRGIAPLITGIQVTSTVIRQSQLRWKIPSKLKTCLSGQTVTSVERRAKYLLIGTSNGTVIIHLGMSGSLRVVDCDTLPEKHDHFDIAFDNGKCLRLRDPRRFGAVLWTDKDPLGHKLLNQLGVEPLQREFNGKYLFEKSRNRKIAIKSLLMDSHIVAGVGNIYASEALFLAGIRPQTAAKRINRQRMDSLADATKKVLREAIKSGGTTFRDFTKSDGKPGYFQQKLNVYNRAGHNCTNCGSTIVQIKQNQRATYYCKICQT